MNETNPFDSPHAKLNEPEKKKWRRGTSGRANSDEPRDLDETG